MKSYLSRGNFFVVLVALAVVCIASGVANCGIYSGGTGEPNNPYLISTAEDMNAIGADSNDWDKHFILTTDINLANYTGEQFNIIGNWLDAFRGVFDGNGHTISNFTYSSTGTDNIGIFGYMKGETAEIKDLGLIDPNIINTGISFRTGALLGYLKDGTVTRCHVEGGSVSGYFDVGGFVGSNDSGYITDCHSTGSISGRICVGGLVGINSGCISDSYSEADVSGYVRTGGVAGSSEGTILKCSTSGSVVTPWTSGSRNYTGGLVGYNSGDILYSFSTASVTGHLYVGGLVGEHFKANMSYCYSTGSVSGYWHVGGLVGCNWNSGISSCYVINSVSGNRSVGGLVGYNSHRYGSFYSISGCYAATKVVGSYNVGGLVGYDEYGSYGESFWDNTINPSLDGIGNTSDPNVMGESTANMQTASTFVDACWDFTSPIWTIDEGNDYPRLWWEQEEPGYGGGTGEPGSPYLIFTAEQLNAVGRHINGLDKHFKLMADIDLSSFTGTAFNIIGDAFIPFSGVFDGNDHTISNFTYTGTETDHIGLFGYVYDPNAKIENLGLIGPNIDVAGGRYVGGLVGALGAGEIIGCYVERGSISGEIQIGGLVGENRGGISNCYSVASVSATSRYGYVGGLVGYNGGGTVKGTIEECYSMGSVMGNDRVGGLVGQNNYGTISECYSSSNVSATGNYIGGLVGYNGWVRHEAVIENCYSSGNVSGDSYVGGLVGYNYGDILNSYSSGGVTGTGSYVYGLVGHNRYPYAGVYDCFWDIETSGRTNSAGGTGKTTAEMQAESTFTDAGWDFNTPVWTIDEGKDYPRLWWENTAPVACIVGGDRTIEAGSGCEARITLDGSCSSDSDSTPGTNDDIVTFDWYEGDTLLGTGEIIDCNLPLGEHIIVLEVTDKADAFDSNEVTIIVEDTTPPEFTLSVAPDTLWPPNRKMVEITPVVTVSDLCDHEPNVFLKSIVIREDDEIIGDEQSSDDIEIGGDSSIYLRAERSGTVNGRIYTITYRAVDDSGNYTEQSTTVSVPHDQR